MITGANGLLGQHLVKMLMGKGLEIVATGMAESRLSAGEEGLCRYYSADITDEQALHSIMEKERPQVVIHAAAMTQVDECEEQKPRCFATNVLGTVNMITAAEKFSQHFIYISTDFVFEGEKGNYDERDERNPVNWYGQTKLQAEDKTSKCRIPWAIVRTGLVYGLTPGGARSNIITWVKDNLERRQKISVVSDQVRTPTFVNDLASGIGLIIALSAQGTFHIAGKDILTPWQIAGHVAGHFGLDGGLIKKVDASSFSQPGRRPLVTDLLIDRARKELGYKPGSFEEGLYKMFK